MKRKKSCPMCSNGEVVIERQGLYYLLPCTEPSCEAGQYRIRMADNRHKLASPPRHSDHVEPYHSDWKLKAAGGN